MPSEDFGCSIPTANRIYSFYLFYLFYLLYIFDKIKVRLSSRTDALNKFIKVQLQKKHLILYAFEKVFTCNRKVIANVNVLPQVVKLSRVCARFYLGHSHEQVFYFLTVF